MSQLLVLLRKDDGSCVLEACSCDFVDGEKYCGMISTEGESTKLLRMNLRPSEKPNATIPSSEMQCNLTLPHSYDPNMLILDRSSQGYSDRLSEYLNSRLSAVYGEDAETIEQIKKTIHEKLSLN